MPSSTHTHNHNMPPISYSDLTRHDISLLIPIFTPLPPSSKTSAEAAYHKTTKSLIDDLPKHLQSKYPLINTFCHRFHHDRLNPLPLTSLLAALGEEVDRREGLGHVERGLLEILRGIMNKGGNCKACVLCEMAAYPEALSVLGSCVIKHVGHKRWKRSRRVRWMEVWSGVLGGDVGGMWMKAKNEDGCRRMPPVRPPRSEEQEDHVEIVIANMMLQQQTRNPDDYEQALIPENNANPFDDEANPEDVMRHLFPEVRDGRTPLPQGYSNMSMVPEPLVPLSSSRAASSVYSRPQTESWSTVATIRPEVASSVSNSRPQRERTPTTVDQIIDMYRDSRSSSGERRTREFL